MRSVWGFYREVGDVFVTSNMLWDPNSCVYPLAYGKTGPLIPCFALNPCFQEPFFDVK